MRVSDTTFGLISILNRYKNAVLTPPTLPPSQDVVSTQYKYLVLNMIYRGDKEVGEIRIYRELIIFSSCFYRLNYQVYAIDF